MKNSRSSLDWRLSCQSAIGGTILLFILIHLSRPKSSTSYPKFTHLYDHDVYWELPSHPLGILLFLHGCNHQGGDLFPPTSSCPTCLGLPEEQRTRKLALHNHSLAVVAISSLQATKQGKGCWDPNHDLSSVPALLNKLITEVEPQLQNLPIYALGVSSGGSIALLLPKVMKLAGICAQIMAISPQELENIIYTSSTQQTHFTYPPTVFMHMPRDVHTASYVEENAAVLQSKNIAVAVMQTAPRPLTPKFLTLHSDGQISQNLAVDIVKALKQHKLLDNQEFLVKDPRQSREEWVFAVQPVTGNFISLEPNNSPLMTLMNVAYAQHEIITSGLDSALKWLESSGQGDLVEFLAEEEAIEAAEK